MPACGNDQVLINGKCACRTGLYNVQGSCQQCPENSYISAAGCVCQATGSLLPPGAAGCPSPNCGANSRWDVNQKACVCNSGYQWIYGGCQIVQQCPPNSVYNGVECVCNYGFRKQGNQCVSTGQNYHCPDNSFFNGVSCTCKDGFFPINNQCQRCPTGTYWTGSQCTVAQTCQSGFTWNPTLQCCIYTGFQCAPSEQWNGVRCECRQGYFYINNQCQQCPSGTVFDGKQCTSGLPSNQCNGPYQYFNGHVCVCVPGYWQLGNGCVTCPTGYQWNGVCCEAKFGLTRAVAAS